MLLAFIMASQPLRAQQLLPEVVTENPIKKAYPRFSILGDSFGAFEGTTTNPGFLIQYPDADVKNEEDIYFRQLQAETGMDLRQNNSMAGTCVSYIGILGNGGEVAVSFVNRSKGFQPANLFIIEGGTNDSYHYLPGEYKWSDWTDEELNTWRAALACVISNFQTRYRQFDVIFVHPPRLEDMTEASRTICEHYNVPFCLLHDLPMVGVHPTVEGHHLMGNQIANTLAEHLGWTVWDGEEKQVNIAAGTIDQLYWRISLDANRWQGVIFPFRISQALANLLFGEGTRLAVYGHYDSEANTLHFTPAETVEANTPMLICPANAVGPVLCLKGLQTETSDGPKIVGTGKFRLRGLYTKTTLSAASKNAIMIDSEGQARMITEDTQVLPFQAYIYATRPEVPNIVFDGTKRTQRGHLPLINQQVQFLDIGIVIGREVGACVVVHHYRHFAVSLHSGDEFLHVLGKLVHRILLIARLVNALITERQTYQHIARVVANQVAIAV